MNLIIESVTHIFPGSPPRKAVDGLSFQVETGQFVAIVGPSGCGKSTLLRLIANLLQPTGGKILLDGLTPAQAASQHRVAWMSQSPALLPWLTARENVALALKLTAAGKNRQARGSAAAVLTPEQTLERVGLAEEAGAYPFTLSGGMQQRLALARTLSLQSDLWLMDEPFASLDELTRERLSDELLELWKPQRPTVLWVTHNLYEALRLADRILVFTRRPARLAADLTVDLPRPRDEGSLAFAARLKQLRKALEDG